MRIRDGHVVYSPSDLNVFFESPFASWMDRAHAHAPRESAEPDPARADMALLAAMGDAHERAYLDQLIAAGHDVWQPPAALADSRDTDAKVAVTLAAMRDGREILFQATLRHDGFDGHADFLRRVDTPSSATSKLGAFHYEVLDTKLARKPKPYFLLQLCAYAEMLEAVQGVRPTHVHVVNGAREVLPFRTDDYFFFYLTLKRAFLAQQARFDPHARPIPDARADHGRWQTTADAILDELDHPSRVAGITGRQVARLADAGIRTMKELATTTLERVPQLDASIFARLRDQARLQVDSAGLPRPLFEIVIPSAPTDDDPSAAARGLALLPPPSPLDVFFDMEGYPLVEGGLEYLFGSMVVDELTGERRFVDFWAHDSAQEKRAFEAFLDWTHARFVRDPSMHVYHYAPYEVTALKRLASTYGTREEQLDDLLRAEVFVDLYRVVRQGVRIGEPRYSLKNVEHLYRGARSGEVANAGQSVVEYARWLEMKDGADHWTSAILGAIRDYNLDDCESTLQLCEWLREQKVKENIAYIAPPPKDEAKSTTLIQRDDELYSAKLLAQIPEDRSADPERWRMHELLAWLVVFHRREDKPFWWNIFAKMKETDEELVEDSECLGGLERTETAPQKAARSMLYEYRFPPQETKVDGGGSCFVAGHEMTRVEVAAIDLDAGRLTVKVGPKKPPPPARMSLIPGEYINAVKIAESIRRTAEAWEATRKLPGALATLLHRELPRLEGHTAGANLLAKDEDLVEGTVRVIRAMRETTLAIQGPPGAGKTTAASHAILALIRDGKRVALSSNSHKAIEKLMEDTLALARNKREIVRATKIGGDKTSDVVEKYGATHAAGWKNVELDGPERAQLVGGTAWKFVDEVAVGQFDYLFVDEAGQVSLANLVGMAPCAKNIVLLGDQMQLSQPTQAAHPGQSGMSSLDYLMDVGQTTIRPEQGIFLAKTWRLHPKLCSFISGAFYEDRLAAEVCTEKRVVRASAPGMAEAGLRFVSVPHEENVQCSEEEADAIEKVAKELLARELVLEDGTTRPLTANDILVVAPYNLQVRLLRKRLGALKIASVDKFQGQQAAVVILSMCASSGDGSPRGLDFLFSPNRLNVAISRAQCLAIVVGSPALAESRVTSVKQMKLVNLYCRILTASGRA
jgi:predicted RecB family nuclease